MRERKRITYKEGDNCKYVPILGVGHPRTGTGYTSKILSKWGLNVLHENIGKDGIVSWFLAFETGPFLWQNQFSHRPAYDHLIYNVRNPRESLASIVYTETPHTIYSNFEKQGNTFVVNTSPRQRLDFISHRWRSARIHGMEQKNPIESAIVSICAFNDMINYLKPDVTYRIEDQDKLLYEYLEKAARILNHPSLLPEFGFGLDFQPSEFFPCGVKPPCVQHLTFFKYALGIEPLLDMAGPSNGVFFHV